jgi:hypothetical protein
LGLAALALQMPGGAIVDAARSERGVAALAMIAISASALVIALWPIFPSVLGAQILHAAGSSVVNPAIAAISLGLVGHAASGERFGRNARFASIGNGLAAAGMGAVGYFWSNQELHRRTPMQRAPPTYSLALCSRFDCMRRRHASSSGKPRWHPSATVRATPAVIAKVRSEPMVFIVATGEPNACGLGCNEWIARTLWDRRPQQSKPPEGRKAPQL